MCVIAAIPKGSILPSYHLLKQAWDTNPHGAGFMYPVPERNELVIVKGLMTWNAFKTAFSEHREHISKATEAGPEATVDVCVHFRIRSHGPINPEMTHPFLIPDQANVAIAHNGIISGLRSAADISDTVVYIEDVLAKLPKGWQRNRPIRGLIERDIGRGNKFVIMDGRGICAILNRTSGTTDAQTNVWWSNTYHLSGRPEPKRRSNVFADVGFVHNVSEDEEGCIREWYSPSCEDAPPPSPCASLLALAAEPAAPAPVKPAAIRTRCPIAMAPIIHKAVYDPETGMMHLHLFDPLIEKHEVRKLTFAEAEVVRSKLRKGEMVSECSLKGNPSYVEVLAAMKAHHDATE